MPKRIPRVAKKSVKAFQREFRKQIITGITAAFAFLIALTWREPISDSVNIIIERIYLANPLLVKYISAIIVTLIAAVALIIVTRWRVKDEVK